MVIARGLQRMHAYHVHRGADAGLKSAFQDDVAVDQGAVERAVGVVTLTRKFVFINIDINIELVST